MKEVYLDGASNTPLDKKVFKKMKPYLSNKFMGNSLSIHDFGIRASMAVEKARSQVAQATKAKTQEVFFTSGATEGNNWVIKSVAMQQLSNGMKRPKVICAATEHSSVLNACLDLRQLGFEVVIVPPVKGKITLKQVKSLIDTKTCLVCVMAVNNETGVANEVEAIANLVKKKRAISLIDCTQMMSYGGNYIELCSLFPHGDCFTFSAHKFYGPMGVGAAIIRKDIKIWPLLRGGAQENGQRGGTSNVAGIVGLGEAIEQLHQSCYKKHYCMLAQYFMTKLGTKGVLNVVPDHCNILSVNFTPSVHLNNLAAILATYGVAVSAGSACDTVHDDIEGFNPSHVLTAMGLKEDEIRNTVRISFTKYTTFKDIDIFFKNMDDIIQCYAK